MHIYIAVCGFGFFKEEFVGIFTDGPRPDRWYLGGCSFLALVLLGCTGVKGGSFIVPLESHSAVLKTGHMDNVLYGL